MSYDWEIPMHVLLIEDDELVASGIQAGLESHDFVVDQASTLVEARMAMASVASDVAILDLGLPDGDGMGLAIVSAIAERFSGRLSFAHNAPHSLVAQLWFPVVEEIRQSSDPPDVIGGVPVAPHQCQ